MRGLILLLALGACAAAPRSESPASEVEPRAVALWQDTLTARMSDGTLCTAPRDGGSGPWATRFGGCPHPWGVDVRRTTSRPRLPLARGASDPWVVIDGTGGAMGYAPALGS